MDTKRCTKCNQDLPSSLFSKRSSTADGLQVWCKACTRVLQRAYYEQRKARPHVSAPTKVCTKCGVEQPTEAFGRDSAKPDGLFAWCRDCAALGKRKWYEANRARSIETARAWQRANPEQHRENCRANYHRHPDVYQFSRRKSAAKRKGALDLSLTRAEWEAIVAQFDGKCFYCGGPSTDMDHLIPLSTGGQHTKENVVPSCRPCNRQKYDMALVDFRPDLLDRLPYRAAYLQAHLTYLERKRTLTLQLLTTPVADVPPNSGVGA